MKKVMMGNHAISHGATLARVQVIAAYPITPQTQVVELLSEIVADGKLKAEFIKVESEHSAMAACIGASSAGARAFTATSAQGLALMHELLHWAAGARLPIVMADINRAMAPPWTIWTDQNDSLSQRDTGWMQFYCQSNQEVLDSVIMAYKMAEKVLMPVDDRPRRLLALPHLRDRRPARPGAGGQVPAALRLQVQARRQRPAHLRRPHHPRLVHGVPRQDAGGHGAGAGGDQEGGRGVREGLRPPLRPGRALHGGGRRHRAGHVGHRRLDGALRRRPDARRRARRWATCACACCAPSRSPMSAST